MEIEDVYNKVFSGEERVFFRIERSSVEKCLNRINKKWMKKNENDYTYMVLREAFKGEEKISFTEDDLWKPKGQIAFFNSVEGGWWAIPVERNCIYLMLLSILSKRQYEKKLSTGSYRLFHKTLTTKSKSKNKKKKEPAPTPETEK